MVNKKFILIFFLLILIYLLHKKKFVGGGGIADMPDGPAKENALKKQKEIQENMKNNIPQSKKTIFDNFAVQQSIKKNVDKYGKTFLTYLYLSRIKGPSFFENPITNKLVWIPLDGDDNIQVRSYTFGIPHPVMVPNLKETEELTDRMSSHSLPLPPLFLADLTTTQIDIFAKWYKKYYVDKKYPQKEGYITRTVRKFIDNL